MSDIYFPLEQVQKHNRNSLTVEWKEEVYTSNNTTVYDSRFETEQL